MQTYRSSAQKLVCVQDFDFWIDGAQVTISPDGAPVNLTGDVFTIGAGYTFADTYRVDVSSSNLSVGFCGPDPHSWHVQRTRHIHIVCWPFALTLAALNWTALTSACP